MRALLALGLLVACSSPPKEQRILEGRASPRPQTAPPPEISFHDGAFDLVRLPAVARSGQLVVVPVVESDGGRGFPNLRVEVRSRADRVTQRIEIMTSNEYETLVPNGAVGNAELDRRIRAANGMLDALHGNEDLVAMQKIDKPKDLAIDFAARGWLAPKGRRCAQCPPCENPPYLDGVYKAEGIDVLLVRIAYEGTDTCWEPSPQLHVIVK